MTSRFLLDYLDGATRVKWQDFTNHQLRVILIGIWLAMDADDREDHIRELEHYTVPSNRPPLSSTLIADALKASRVT